MSHYKLVASDMDETFLHDSCIIPEGNKAALARMRELGVLFVPCSGRAYNSIAANLDTLDPELLDSTYIISFNGGFINRYGDPKPLCTCGISYEAADAIYRRGRELGLCIHVCFDDGTYNVFDPPASERDFLASYPSIRYQTCEGHPDLSFLEKKPIVKVLYMSEDFDGLRKLGATMNDFAEDLGTAITFSSNRYLEFMPQGVTKATGLAKLAELLGIGLDQIIGFGDSANDIAMLDAAGLGVGVANVTDDAREHCDVVLDSTCFEGALLELVERFLEP